MTAKQHVENAYHWIERIPVDHDNVDYMAMARQELREALMLLSRPPVVEKEMPKNE